MSPPVYANVQCSSEHGSQIMNRMRATEDQNLFLIGIGFPGISSDSWKKAAGVKRLNQIQAGDMYILLIALGKSLNITLKNRCQDYETYECNMPQVWADISTQWWEQTIWYSSTVVTGSKNVHFLTCNSKTESSLNLYAKPFDGVTWTGVGLSALVVTVSLKLISVEQAKLGGMAKCRNGLDTFILLYWVIGTLLEQIETVGMKVGRYSAFRILVGVWILVCTVMTHGYRSLIIMSLNSPLGLVFPDTFEVSLFNFM